MTMLRDAVLTATILALILIADNRSRPVKTVETPYCVVSVYQGFRDKQGNLHTGWGPMYRPCSEQPDIYREI